MGWREGQEEERWWRDRDEEELGGDVNNRRWWRRFSSYDEWKGNDWRGGEQEVKNIRSEQKQRHKSSDKNKKRNERRKSTGIILGMVPNENL